MGDTAADRPDGPLLARLVAEGRVEPGGGDCGAYFAEVGVNAATGDMRLRRVMGVFAARRILDR